MKSRVFLPGWPWVVSAVFLLVFNLLITGTAFGATTPPGNPPSADRGSWRRRPIDVRQDSSGRTVGVGSRPGLASRAGQTSASALPAATNLSSSQSPLDRFVDSVRDGQSGLVRGVYVPGVLALRVVQQPAGNPNYVSLAPGIATQYAAAGNYGVTGLLADDASAGVLYYSLASGQAVSLVFGDGRVLSYRVSAIYRYRALSPSDPYSDFVDVDSGEQVTAVQLFGRIYAGGNHITFQTCLAQDGLLNWGRLFVIATPL